MIKNYKEYITEKLSDKLSGFDAESLKKQYESGKINIFKYLSLCEQNNIDIDYDDFITKNMKDYDLDMILNLSMEYNFSHGIEYATKHLRIK